MNNIQIIRIIREAALQLKHNFNSLDLRFVEVNNRSYTPEEFAEFKRDLIEAGNKIKMLFLEFALEPNRFKTFRETEDSLILFFKREGNKIIPTLSTSKKDRVFYIDDEYIRTELFSSEDSMDWLTNENGEVVFFVVQVYKSLVSDYQHQDPHQQGISLSPSKRLFRLLGTEKKEISYVAFYALVIGLMGLILPLGIQTTVELISGGVFFSSVYLLIGLVILGVLVSGVLQIVQISLVEHLQRRVFTKASLEFAFRIPRLRAEAIMHQYAPELVNRFFDVMTIQKALPKVLIDLSSGAIQILFGLILLSLYHPFFIFFSLILLISLYLIFYFTGPQGLSSSINESKYKYKVAQWLEELARTINSFKLAGSTNLPIRKTDDNVNNYLKHRKAHFSVLITQFSFAVLFKTVITGGLLIMGTILVVNREITLGQFVAAEVIIILVLNAVEKIITYMDVVYDLFTAVDKVAQVTDLSLERAGGIDLPISKGKGYAIQVKNLAYKYPDKPNDTLKNIELDIQSGERICIAGPGGSGKTTLTNIIAGLHHDFEGIVTINNYSIRDLDLTHLRDKIGKNISQEDIFDGTLLENITIGKPMETIEDAVEALRKVGLSDTINSLPNGLSTHLVSGGKGMPSSMLNRLILARCLAKKPELIILNDFFGAMRKEAKLELMQCVVDRSNPWTLLMVSNDPQIMQKCDRVIVLNNGTIEADATYDQLLREGIISKYFE